MRKSDLKFFVQVILPLFAAITAFLNFWMDAKFKTISTKVAIIESDVNYTKKNLQFWLTLMQNYQWSGKSSENLQQIQNNLDEILKEEKS